MITCAFRLATEIRYLTYWSDVRKTITFYRALVCFCQQHSNLLRYAFLLLLVVGGSIIYSLPLVTVDHFQHHHRHCRFDLLLLLSPGLRILVLAVRVAEVRRVALWW